MNLDSNNNNNNNNNNEISANEINSLNNNYNINFNDVNYNLNNNNNNDGDNNNNNDSNRLKERINNLYILFEEQNNKLNTIKNELKYYKMKRSFCLELLQDYQIDYQRLKSQLLNNNLECKKMEVLLDRLKDSRKKLLKDIMKNELLIRKYKSVLEEEVYRYNFEFQHMDKMKSLITKLLFTNYEYNLNNLTINNDNNIMQEQNENKFDEMKIDDLYSYNTLNSNNSKNINKNNNNSNNNSNDIYNNNSNNNNNNSQIKFYEDYNKLYEFYVSKESLLEEIITIKNRCDILKSENNELNDIIQKSMEVYRSKKELVKKELDKEIYILQHQQPQQNIINNNK